MSKTPVLVLLALSAALSGCLTPRVKPAPSPAIVEARARAQQARAHPATLCGGVSLAADKPVEVPFAYERDELTDPGRDALDQVASWLICKPAAYAAITGESDPTGTAEARQAIAARRVVATRAYLAAHGVAASRLLTVQPAGGQVLAVVAKGRGW